MVTRRSFIINTTAFVAAGSGALVGGFSSLEHLGFAMDADKESAAVPSPSPDTLDLAEHGRLAINGLLGSLDPRRTTSAPF